MFRLLWRLIVLIALGLLVLWAANFKIAGKPVKQYAADVYHSELVREGIKDISTWVRELVQGVGGKVEEKITESDRKEIEDAIKGELRENVRKMKEGEGGKR